MRNRRNFIWAKLAVSGVLCSVAMVVAPAVAQGPIKIGVIHPYSGPLSAPGEDATNGFELYFKQVGNRVAGRAIEVIKEDTAAQPAQGIERTRRLVERREVHMLAGITSSAVAYAVRDYVHQNKVPLVVMGSAGANGITAERASPYIFRTSFTNKQFNAPFGPYVCNKLGHKRAVVMFSDFVTGHEQSAAFEETYAAAGCKVVKKIAVPLGNADFVPFLSQITPGEADTVWAMFFGADAIAFVKQYAQVGLKSKLPLIGSAGLAYERLLPAMRDDAVGIVIPTFYTIDLGNDANKKFVADYRTEFKGNPGSTASSGYVAAWAITVAIEQVQGRVEDKEAFLAALRKVSLPSTPQGPFRFDAKQNVVFDLVAARVVSREGTFIPAVVDRIATNVSQDWKPN
jgi:branched-chain amino acid transport system substrate-binding protein